VLLPPGKYVGGGGEYLCKCPDCSKEKFYWNVGKEVGFCHRCQKKIIGETQFQKEFDSLLVPTTGRASGSTMVPPMRYPAFSYADSTTYLKHRWITLHQSLSIPIKYDPEKREIWVPIQPLSPELPKSWIKRSIDFKGWRIESGTKRKHYAFGQEHIPTDQTSVILVEGVFDVLSPGLLGHAMALLGSSLSGTHMVYIANRFKHVKIWMDPDMPGQNAARKIKQNMVMYGIEHEVLSPGVEPGDMGPMHPYVKELRNE
jgi:hypothetical protein